MGFSVDFDEQTSLLLTERAKQLNIDPSSLVQNIVRAQFTVQERKPVNEEERRRFREVVREVEELSVRAGAPALSEEAFTRVAIYADHD